MRLDDLLMDAPMRRMAPRGPMPATGGALPPQPMPLPRQGAAPLLVQLAGFHPQALMQPPVAVAPRQRHRRQGQRFGNFGGGYDSSGINPGGMLSWLTRSA